MSARPPFTVHVDEAVVLLNELRHVDRVLGFLPTDERALLNDEDEYSLSLVREELRAAYLIATKRLHPDFDLCTAPESLEEVRELYVSCCKTIKASLAASEC